MDIGWTAKEIAFIEDVRQHTYPSKATCFTLKRMREKLTQKKEAYDCFCKFTTRRLYVKEFLIWYDSTR